MAQTLGGGYDSVLPVGAGGQSAWHHGPVELLGRRLTQAFFARDVAAVAPDLLGRVIVRESEDGAVAVRLTEVEA